MKRGDVSVGVDLVLDALTKRHIHALEDLAAAVRAGAVTPDEARVVIERLLGVDVVRAGSLLDLTVARRDRAAERGQELVLAAQHATGGHPMRPLRPPLPEIDVRPAASGEEKVFVGGYRDAGRRTDLATNPGWMRRIWSVITRAARAAVPSRIR